MKPDAHDLGAVMREEFATWHVSQGGCALVGPDGIVASAGDLDEVLPWASVTKVLAALAVLDVVRDGALSLDDPAGPEGSTVRHLLAHASGLSFDSDQVLAGPGKRRIYSNVGIDLVTSIAAEAAGCADGPQLIAERVLIPLDMKQTVVIGSSAHGARGPLVDLARLARELLRPRVLPPAVVEDLATPTFQELAGVLPGYGRQDPNDWGLGAELRGTKSPHWMPDQVSPLCFGHFGQSGSFIWVDRQRELAAVALTGTDFGPWAVDRWSRSGTRWVECWES